MSRDEIINYLQETFGDKIELLETGAVEPVFLLKDKNELHDFCLSIRDDDTLSIDFLCNMAAVDTGEKFEIVYNVASYRRKIRFDFKIVMEYEGAEIDTVLDVWAAANWMEREIWELYGIDIKGHPELKQFLLPDNWDQGHPMRKNWDPPDDFKTMPEV